MCDNSQESNKSSKKRRESLVRWRNATVLFSHLPRRLLVLNQSSGEPQTHTALGYFHVNSNRAVAAYLRLFFYACMHACLFVS